MRISTSTLLRSAAVCGFAIVVAACGGSSSDPKRDPGAPRKVREADLDLGHFAAVGSDVHKQSGNLADGRQVEAGRIAEYLVDPHEIDERFQPSYLPSGAFASPSQLLRSISTDSPVDLVAKRISGAATRRGFAEQGSLDMGVTVLAFTTPQVAAAWVKRVGDMNVGAKDDLFSSGKTYGTPFRVPGHAEARATEFRVGTDDDDPSLDVLAAYDTTVVSVFISGTHTKQLPLAKSLAAEVLTKERELLKDYEPIEQVDLLSLPVDTTGVARLTLQAGSIPKKDEPNVVTVWGPEGALHQQTWAGDLRAAFERADMDVMAQGGGNVYRTGSAAKAKRLLADFGKTVTETQYGAWHTPKGLREARCYQLIDTENTVYLPNFCQVQYGRYVAEAGGKDADEAEAAISAQYLVLQQRAKR